MIRCRLYAGEDGKTLVLGYGKTESVAEKKAMSHAKKRKLALPENPVVKFDEVRDRK